MPDRNKALWDRIGKAEEVIKDLLEVIKYNHAVVEGCYPVKGPNERETVARAKKLLEK